MLATSHIGFLKSLPACWQVGFGGSEWETMQSRCWLDKTAGCKIFGAYCVEAWFYVTNDRSRAVSDEQTISTMHVTLKAAGKFQQHMGLMAGRISRKI